MTYNEIFEFSDDQYQQNVRKENAFLFTTSQKKFLKREIRSLFSVVYNHIDELKKEYEKLKHTTVNYCDILTNIETIMGEAEFLNLEKDPEYITLQVILDKNFK